ncbi:Aste57867_20908 [Aphanomyces stellatus]|uniref:Aste57867_20908 protein n=1 Tax=Aphanomyces stellatus TaxID=120398 RepID=A0A485LG57_9STRA|nr:hypothetical protein As57867_020840 [Aphanomyces stellatus]VFT97585.1 Aste57867_20908 [Aphanomyces stellatus]
MSTSPRQPSSTSLRKPAPLSTARAKTGIPSKGGGDVGATPPLSPVKRAASPGKKPASPGRKPTSPAKQTLAQPASVVKVNLTTLSIDVSKPRTAVSPKKSPTPKAPLSKASTSPKLSKLATAVASVPASPPADSSADATPPPPPSKLDELVTEKADLQVKLDNALMEKLELEDMLKQTDAIVTEYANTSMRYKDDYDSMAAQAAEWKQKHDGVVTLLEETVAAMKVQGQQLNQEAMANEENRNRLSKLETSLKTAQVDKLLLGEKYVALQVATQARQTQDESGHTHLYKDKIQQLKEKLSAASKSLQRSSSTRKLSFEGVGVKSPSVAQLVFKRTSSKSWAADMLPSGIHSEYVPVDDVVNAWQWLSQASGARGPRRS